MDALVYSHTFTGLYENLPRTRTGGGPFATNEQISSVAREIEKDERLLKAFYHMPQKPVFKKESPEFKNKVEELLRTEDPNTRMDIMVNLLIDVRE